MKKSLSVFMLTCLGLSLSGCSSGAVGCGIFVVPGIVCALMAMIRNQNLVRYARTHRLTRREKMRLRERSMQTNMLYIAAAILLVIGIIVGIFSGAAGAGPDETTEPPTSEPVAETQAPTEETGPDLTGIPDSLIELMNVNPETTDFVLNYPNRQPMEINLSEYDRTQGVPLFMQWDPRWGYEIYGSDVLAITGCAPTCVAMVGYYLTGDGKFTPDQMAKFAEEDGHYNNGTNWTFIQDGIEKLGLSTTELPLSEGVLIRNLQAGNPIIINVGPGDFTTTGHYMVLVGYEDGMFRLNDPNRRSISAQTWSYETLASQIRNLWAVKLK